MAAISQTIFSDTFSWMEKNPLLNQILLKVVGPVKNKPAINTRHQRIWTNTTADEMRNIYVFGFGAAYTKGLVVC